MAADIKSKTIITILELFCASLVFLISVLEVLTTGDDTSNQFQITNIIRVLKAIKDLFQKVFHK